MAMKFCEPLAGSVKASVERLYSALREGKTVFIVFPETDEQSGSTHVCTTVDQLEWCLTDISHAEYAVVGERLNLKDGAGETWDLQAGEANRYAGDQVLA